MSSMVKAPVSSPFAQPPPRRRTGAADRPAGGLWLMLVIAVLLASPILLLSPILLAGTDVTLLLAVP